MQTTISAGPNGRSLSEFYNHGTLPFVPREREFARLVGFWKGTAEAQELRAALLIGEAGVGKTRLLEELIPLVAQDGVAVHARLYPGSSTSIAAMLARAIRLSGAVRSLLKKEPDEDIGAVIAALHRLARLRPVLLVVEDFHLLSGEALGEFTILLEALSSEGLSVLAVARPVEPGARGLLERYLVEEIELPGLAAEEIGLLWRELFGTEPDGEVIELLAEHTLGNALALRSALRGVLKSGALVRDAAGVWRPAVALPQFAEALGRNVRLLSEGMTASLTDEERATAAMLAALGEVFARETGLVMASPNEHLVDVLMFKGILVQASSSILPLPGSPSAQGPLAFAHTLLHKHLVDGVAPDARRLMEVVARGLPLYSVLPWRLLAAGAAAIDAPHEVLDAWVARSIARAMALDGTPDWEMAVEIIGIVEAAVQAHSAQWGAEADCVDARIMAAKLELHRRSDHTPEYLEMALRLRSLAERSVCRDRSEHALLAFKYHAQATWRSDYARCRQIWEEAGEFLAAYPELVLTEASIDLMRTFAQAGWASQDEELLRAIEMRLADIMASDSATDAVKDRAWRSIPQFFLNMYADAEELAARLALLSDLEKRLGPQDITLGSLKIALLESIGMPQQLRATITVLAPRLRELGQLRQYYQSLLIGACQDAWFGAAMESVVAAAMRIRAEVSAPLRTRFDMGATFRLLRFALLRGRYDVARSIMDTFSPNPAGLGPHVLVMLASGEGRLRAALPTIVSADNSYPDVAALAALVNDPSEQARADALREVGSMLSEPVLCIEDLVGLACIVDLVREAAADPANAAFVVEARPHIRGALASAFDWMAERSFFGVLEPMLERYGEFVGERERRRWASDAAASREAFAERERAVAGESRAQLTMLGTIEVRRAGAQPVRPRGARLRTVLGLMVANEMLDKPLGYREFCRLAADGEEDPERARKMTSMALLRLRESIGLDLIRTAGETPELDPDRVQVDLLDARRLLLEALHASRGGDLKRALPLLLEAFELIGTEVPFPKLYDDFFEALRSDFDFRVREVAMEVGGALLREGDPKGAEEALQRAWEAMPEDEEIVAALCRSLEAQGKRVEAERIRMRSEE